MPIRYEGVLLGILGAKCANVMREVTAVKPLQSTDSICNRGKSLTLLLVAKRPESVL